MRRACFLLLILAIACVLPRTGNAELVDSKDWLVRNTTHKNLDALTEYFGFPNPEMKKGEAVALIAVTGLRAEILVVGPIEGNAIEYAQVLDDWRSAAGFVGDVQYSQEDDCAAAKVSVGTHRFGILDGSLKLHLNDLRQRLQTVEPKTSVALRVVSKVPVQISDKPDKVTQFGVRYWNLTSKDLAQPHLTVEMRVSPFHLISFVSWFLFLPIGVSVSYFRFRNWSVKSDQPIERQRKAFHRAFLTTLFVGLGLHGIMSILTIPTRFFDPVTYVWFGEPFARIVTPFVLALFLAPMLAYPAFATLGNKIFGPTPDEIILREELGIEGESDKGSELTESERKANKWKMAAVIVCGVIGLGIMAHGWTLTKTSPYRLLIFPLSMLFCGVLPNLILILYNRKKLDPQSQANGPEAWTKLTERLAMISEKVGLSLYPVLLHERESGRYTALAKRKNSVCVTPSILLKFDEDELDWVLAHEAAHHALGHLKNLRFLYVGLFLAAYIPMLVVLFLPERNPRAMPMIMFWLAFVMIPIAIIPRWIGRKQEFAADAYATRLVGNKEAGIKALKKLTLGSTLPGIHDVDMDGHPALQKRIAKIEALDLSAPDASV